MGSPPNKEGDPQGPALQGRESGNGSDGWPFRPVMGTSYVPVVVIARVLGWEL